MLKTKSNENTTLLAEYFSLPVKADPKAAQIKHLRAILRINPGNRRMDGVRAKLEALLK